MDKQQSLKRGLQCHGLVLLGTAIYALGVYLFTAPTQIAPGGVSGAATVINFLTGAPIGLLTAIINIPLVIMGWNYLGRSFIVRTLLSVVAFTLLYDYLFVYIPPYVGNKLLAGVFGGVLIGIGVGVTFLGEGSTGGLDISSKMIQKRFPHLKISMLVFASDMAVILFSAIAYRDIDSAMYAAISMYVQAKCIDLVLYGFDTGRMMVIITRKGEDITGRILSTMDRGVTRIESRGGYSGQDNETLLCAVRQSEYHTLKGIVRDVDPGAFMMAVTASEVVGDGFKAIDAD